MTDLSRRLTIGSINGVRGGWPKPEAKRFVGRFAGRASFGEVKQTQFGEYTRFGGSFFAFNANGDRFESNYIILPEPAQGMVRAAVAGAASNGGGIEFAVDVFIEPDSDPRNARGYLFSCSTVFENADETLTRLEKSLPKLPLLTHSGAKRP